MRVYWAVMLMAVTAVAQVREIPARAELKEGATVYSSGRQKVGFLAKGEEVTILKPAGSAALIRYEVKDYEGAVRAEMTGYILVRTIGKRVDDAVLGKIAGVKLDNRRDRSGQPTGSYLSYSWSITTKEEIVKRPVIQPVCLYERPGGEKLLRYSSGALRESSTKEREVESSTVLRGEGKEIRLVHGNEKLLAWRLELWHDGRLLDAYQTESPAELEARGIPSDWHTHRPGKFTVGR